MKQNLAAGIFRATATQIVASICLLLLADATLAQAGKSVAPHPVQQKATVPALLISDIHFEPFWDPAKAEKLAAAPVSEWRGIFASAPSADQSQRFAALQQTCRARGADTAFPLYDSSLKAMRAHAADARFVTVSGDLLAHAFDCKFKAVFPDSTPTAYRAFVEKTLDYVIDELDKTFPNVLVYVGLGNNDSDCGDYRLDTHTEFLAATGKEVTKNFPAAEQQSVQQSFAVGGYYSVSLPAPIENARLLVLNDIFMSKNYATCAGKADPAAADAQIAWLRGQLDEARAHKQKVWVMGHIPPGIDLHGTATKFIDVCGGRSPVMYLSSEKMADALIDNSDVIELAVFAHTHMDEMHLLKNDGESAKAGKSVAMKMVSSISPINGNKPAFTVAQIDLATAQLVDYKVFASSNASGIEAAWTEEYDFARSYHEPAFTAATISKLIAGFAADPEAKTPASQSYIQDFSVGYLSPVLQAFWPQYVCAVSNHTQQGFRACVCPAVP